MMNKYRNEMIEAISRLVAIPSVFAESSEYPFGPEVDRCLDTALSMMAELGFRTFKAPDGMYGYAEIGEGELFGVLCHLDVVQARQEDGWDHDPFPACGPGRLALRPGHTGRQRSQRRRGLCAEVPAG